MAAARAAAVAGLFSSWVRPAVTVPRATRRSRVLTVCWEPIPWMANPSSMWVAIGNHSRTAQPKSSADRTQKRQSVTVRRPVLYERAIGRSRYAKNAPA